MNYIMLKNALQREAFWLLRRIWFIGRWFGLEQKVTFDIFKPDEDRSIKAMFNERPATFSYKLSETYNDEVPGKLQIFWYRMNY